MECPPDQFTTPADWVPLYTHEGLQKYLPAVLSSFTSQGIPSLTAVVPPQVPCGYRQGVPFVELPPTRVPREAIM